MTFKNEATDLYENKGSARGGRRNEPTVAAGGVVEGRRPKAESRRQKAESGRLTGGSGQAGELKADSR